MHFSSGHCDSADARQKALNFVASCTGAKEIALPDFK